MIEECYSYSPYYLYQIPKIVLVTSTVILILLHCYTTMCSPDLSFVFLVLLISCSVEGSSYCMTDCDSNGQRSFTMYEELCCSPSNKGDIIHVSKDNGRTGYVICPDTIPKWCPHFSSCYDILQSSNSTASSSYYNITLSNGSQVEMYCDMEGSHCDGEGGWTRVAFVNMSVPGSSCPHGLVQYNISNISLCWINNNYTGCNSAFFSTYGLNYTKVCGRVRGYQYGYPFAFFCYIWNISCINSETKTYGMTLTYGNNPRKHTWTYAGGYSEQGTSSGSCPCNDGSQLVNYTIPFVGNDYYCESVTHTYYNKFYPDDPLWDGQNCPGDEATCCTSPKMPWFIKTLNETSNDDIELNVCGYHYTSDYTLIGGTPFDLIELYIK